MNEKEGAKEEVVKEEEITNEGVITLEDIERNYERARRKYFPDGEKERWYEKELISRLKPEHTQPYNYFFAKRNLPFLLHLGKDEMQEFLMKFSLIRLEKSMSEFPFTQVTNRFIYTAKQTFEFQQDGMRQNRLPRHVTLFPIYSSPLYSPKKIEQPQRDSDVFFLHHPLPPSLHSSLVNHIDGLANERIDSPVPNYENIIDPNTLVFNDQWIATDFLIEETPIWNVEIEILLINACLLSTGIPLPLELLHLIRNYVENNKDYLISHIDLLNHLEDASDESEEEEEVVTSDEDEYGKKAPQRSNKSNSSSSPSYKTFPPSFTSSFPSNNQTKKLTAKMMSEVHDLKVEKEGGLHYCIEKVLEGALPMLARLRKPSLLLPGLLQTVIKVQNIFLDKDEKYAGVWHRDGESENIVAVVLYYYRVSDLFSSPDPSDDNNDHNHDINHDIYLNSGGGKGGGIEFIDKRPLMQHIWTSTEGDLPCSLSHKSAVRKMSKLPHCTVEVKEGSLIVFSNYQMIHRVLAMINQSEKKITREFLCFFVVDQTTPLTSTRRFRSPVDDLIVLPSLRNRIRTRNFRLARQLKPAGKFGLSNRSIYMTGNGSAALIGWFDGLKQEEVEEMMNIDTNSPYDKRGMFNYDALNKVPPPNRGISWSLDHLHVPLHLRHTGHNRQLPRHADNDNNNNKDNNDDIDDNNNNHMQILTIKD